MNWEIISAISALIASIATLLTLVYLSIQIRDSNRLAKSSSLQSVLGEYVDRNANNDIQSQEIFFRGFVSWEKLAVTEKGQFISMMTKIILHMQNIMQLHDSKLITDEDFNSWLSWTVSHIKTPGGKEWWKVSKQSYTATVVATIEEFMANNISSPSYEELYPWVFEENTK